MYLVIFLIIYLCWLLKILNLINNKLELIIIKIYGIKNNLIEINKKEKKNKFLKKNQNIFDKTLLFKKNKKFHISSGVLYDISRIKYNLSTKSL